MENKIDELSTSSNVASKNINELTDALQRLSSTCKPLGDALKEVKEPVESLSDGIDLSKLLLIPNQITSIVSGTIGALTGFSTAKETFDKLASTLKLNLSNLTSSFSSTISLYSSALSSSISSLATSISGTLSSAIGFLVSNPLVALAAGLAVAVIGIGIMTHSSQGLTDEQKRLIESNDKLKTKYDELAESQRNANQQAADSMTNAMANYTSISTTYDKLVSLSGPDGYLSNVKEAQIYIDQLNQAGITGLSINEQGVLVQEGTTEAIKAQIEQMRIKAMLQANETAYGEALLSQTELQNDLAQAKKTVNDEEKKYNEVISEYLAQGMTYHEAMGRANADHAGYGVALASSQDALASLNATMVQNQETITNQEALVKAETGTIKERAQANIDLALTYSDVIGAGGEVTYQWQGMGEQLGIFNQQMIDHSNGTKVMTEEEIASNQASRDYLIQCLAEKAVAEGKTREEMFAMCQKYGVDLLKEDETVLNQQYDNLVNSGNYKGVELIAQKNKAISILREHGIEAGTEAEKNYLSQLQLAQEHGAENGASYVENMANIINKKRGVTDAAYNNIGVSGKQQVEKEVANVQVSTTDANKKIDDINNKKVNDKSANVNMSVSGSGVGAIAGGTIGIALKYSLCASGGFPDTGELFVAREAGPELVGRINGKTAVANNDQIVSGISAGVYNAVTSAMSGVGNKGNLNINAIFTMDGEVVGRQVIKYHNGVVKRTGKTPLLV